MALLPVKIKFYGNLNDFLPQGKKNKYYKITVSDHQTIKDVFESEGVPHVEVDVILVNNKTVSLNYRLSDQDIIQIYPVRCNVKAFADFHIQINPLKYPRFILDVHLGKLARKLRMCGIDASLFNGITDNELVNIGRKERRIVLTRDIELLKRNNLKRGYWIRNENPDRQLIEVIKRFDLNNHLNPFYRCLDCNGIIKMVSKNRISHKLPDKVRVYFNEIFQCSSCHKLYWKGSHYLKMKLYIEKLG
jgi:uncharacterized protein